jgi:HEAT repeat protein
MDDFLAALQDSDSRKRMQAAWELGQLGDKTAIPALEEALGDESIAVVKAALMALGRIGSCEVVPILLEMLEHDSIVLRKAAVQAFGKTGCGDTIPLLVQLLEDESLEQAARDAIISLGSDPDFF